MKTEVILKSKNIPSVTKRIVTFPLQTAKSVRIYITDTKTTPLIGEIDAYKIDDTLIEKE